MAASGLDVKLPDLDRSGWTSRKLATAPDSKPGERKPCEFDPRSIRYDILLGMNSNGVFVILALTGALIIALAYFLGAFEPDPVTPYLLGR